MSGNEVSIQGADEFQKRAFVVKGVVQALPKRRRRFLTLSIQRVKRAAAQTAPVKSGTLKRGIGYEVDQDCAYLTSGVAYGLIQERGGKTKPHDIFPRNAKVLAWRTSAASPFIQRIRFGNSKMLRSLSASNIASATKRLRAGKAVSGMYFHWPAGRGVHHPGSRIKPQRYAMRAFESCRGFILSEAAKIVNPEVK